MFYTLKALLSHLTVHLCGIADARECMLVIGGTTRTTTKKHCFASSAARSASTTPEFASTGTANARSSTRHAAPAGSGTTAAGPQLRSIPALLNLPLTIASPTTSKLLHFLHPSRAASSFIVPRDCKAR
ncbi:hypothetical protein C8R45DRAFT_559466 [Mycena sanguinolenta]|nr:hypothetical protein C8R45DRAFT_559466 [Mycena sanguinolenta]